MRTFLTKERDAGFALKGNDIVSVFKHPNAPYRNVTKSMLDLAKQNGGKRLDAFDTMLPHLYSQSGFRAVARLPWNEEYKPDGWDHMDYLKHNGGRPDVVFMIHDPQAGLYQPTDGRKISDYDEGSDHQHAALAQVEARGDVPAAPGPEAYGSGQLIRSSNPLQAWHASPHVFKGTRANPLGEFDLSKIGTGEGAQVYGHGGYLAENKGVGEEYQRDFGQGVLYKGEPLPSSRTDPHEVAVHNVGEYMRDLGHTPEQAIEAVQKEYAEAAGAATYHFEPGITASARAARHERAQFYHGVNMAAQRLDPAHFEHHVGNLYEAELHIDPEHMLHWDKPLAHQSEYVQSQLAKHGLIHPQHHANLRGEDIHASLQHGAPTGFNERGQALYDAMSAIMNPGRNKAAAAQALLQAGIPGIKYADQGSRRHIEDAQRLRDQLTMMGPGTPERDIAVARQRLAQSEAQITHNHVIFDPRSIHIVRRNGLPAMVEAGADALRDHKAGT